MAGRARGGVLGYRIVGPAGRGGSSTVVRARRAGSSRRADRAGEELALKLARTPDHRGTLAREAVLATWLGSPTLTPLVDLGWALVEDTEVRVHDRPVEGGVPFLAFRWLDGGPPQPGIRSALVLARDVGEALSDLHLLGFAHGDVKLDNVVCTEGRATLIDLGLAGPATATEIAGATIRYLPRHDAEQGDARARDLLALGVCLAELCDDEVRASADPIAAARAASLPSPIAGLCRALLAPSPGARPSARWVAETARAALAARGEAERDPTHEAELRARRVRGSYLRVRRAEILCSTSAAPDTAPWLSEAIRCVDRARSLDPSVAARPTGLVELAPMRGDEIARFLTSLVGPAAAAWPAGVLSGVPEERWVPALESLAREREPAGWVLQDLERALSSEPRSRHDPERSVGDDDAQGVMTAASAVELALAVARVPCPAWALSAIEQAEDAPAPLVIAAADALRLAGENGRALALALRPTAAIDPRSAGVRIDVLRRAGDHAGARDIAAELTRRGGELDGRARAALARMELDDGRPESAEAILAGGPDHPLASEVRALLALSRGQREEALVHVAEAQASASTPEERARALGIAGHVTHGTDPKVTADAYRAAAEHAMQAGAIMEEATYRSGEAAGAVHLGQLDRAIVAALRAALLWEHLGRPANAARARLALAAAYATAGAPLETTQAAQVAIELAGEASDRRAAAFAHWAIADVHPAGSEAGARAALDAASLLSSEGEDGLRAAARLLRHHVLDESRIPALDAAALSDGELTAEARLEWWGARAEDLLTRRRKESSSLERPDAVVANLSALVGSAAPVSARGPAFAAGYALASEVGHGDAARRMMAALAGAAELLAKGAPPGLAASVRQLPWVMTAEARRRDAHPPRAELARELEDLVRSLGERERLSELLRRVVDALVLWTGVERGLLLLSAPDGRLVPRAARNLARHDLVGEQLVLSQTLAKRALSAREPVVAVDAAGELSTLHESVHALKLRSVLAVPLVARGEAVGVVYLDDRMRRGAFGEQELAWTKSIATLLALVIADARDQVLLRRAARRATRLAARLERALAEREARLEVAERELAGHRVGRQTRFAYDHIVGESEPMRALLQTVDRVTAADVPVLIFGQSGSGKELIARAIHDNGARAGQAFVSENCGAIPETLLESTLFGHVRGAFTGADRPRAGLFEVAHQGTLFLDEIGEMSLPMQAKLLRVLEDGLVRPLGSERVRKVDTRIVAATHRDLAAMVKQGLFREDLFYRLNIITLTLPPLRDRAEDIPLLVERMIAKHGDGRAVRVTRGAMDRLMAFAWPGNVRQLENEVRRTLVLCDDVIDREHLSPEIGLSTAHNPVDLGLHVKRRVDALEADLVSEALARTRGNQTQAAKLLGLSRFGLQKMMKRLGLSAER